MLITELVTYYENVPQANCEHDVWDASHLRHKRSPGCWSLSTDETLVWSGLVGGSGLVAQALDVIENDAICIRTRHQVVAWFLWWNRLVTVLCLIALEEKTVSHQTSLIRSYQTFVYAYVIRPMFSGHCPVQKMESFASRKIFTVEMLETLPEDTKLRTSYHRSPEETGVERGSDWRFTFRGWNRATLIEILGLF